MADADGEVSQTSKSVIVCIRFILFVDFPDLERCDKRTCNVSRTLNVTDEHDNIEIGCYLMQHIHETGISKYDIVLKEVRVILRKRGRTTDPKGEYNIC